MKRTKENWLQKPSSNRNEISGLKVFDGEDLYYQERKKAFQRTQKKWLEEQKLEKEERIKREKEENLLYFMQTKEINRMRGLLLDDLEAKKKQMNQTTRDFNKNLEREKKERIRKEKLDKLVEEEKDLEHQSAIRQVPAYINPLN